MSRSITLVVLLLVSTATATSEGRADIIYSYNAGLGTLPTTQGWTLYQDSPNLPAPTVSAGILHQFPNPNPPQSQFWFQNSVPLNFSTTSYTYELDLHIISSNYINFGSAQRSGYYMLAFDQIGRGFAVGIAGNGITINTDENFNPNNGVRFTPFNTTDGFHLYRLTIGQGVGSLFIDGTLFASTPLALAPGRDPGNFNGVYFGDGSGVGVSESELRSARFGILATPEPATLLVFGVGAVGLLAARLRRRVAGQLAPVSEATGIDPAGG